MNLAQQTPAQAWLLDWVTWLSEMLPVIFLLAVLAIGIALVFKAGSGLGKVIMFGLGAALVFLFITNVEAVSSFFSEELPIQVSRP